MVCVVSGVDKCHCNVLHKRPFAEYLVQYCARVTSGISCSVTAILCNLYAILQHHPIQDRERFSSMKHVIDLFNSETFQPQEGFLQLLVTKQIEMFYY